MSLKINAFIKKLGNPLTRHNFVVRSPLLGGMEMLVSSTTFPSEQMRDVILYYLGERIKWPTIPENSGVWNANIPEGEDGQVFVALGQQKGILWNQKLGILQPGIKSQIEVVARTVNDAEVFKVVLHGCYIKGPSDIDLDYMDPTQAWRWNWTFSFDWIENIELKPGPTVTATDVEPTA